MRGVDPGIVGPGALRHAVGAVLQPRAGDRHGHEELAAPPAKCRVGRRIERNVFLQQCPRPFHVGALVLQGVELDRAAAPERGLDDRHHEAGDQERRQQGGRDQSLEGMLAYAQGARAAVLEQRIEEIVVEAQSVVEALQPAVGILLEAEVIHLDHAEVITGQELFERLGAEMPIVARHVKVKPGAPEKPGLQALGVGHGDGQKASRLEQLARAGDGLDGLGEVLERVPED